MLKNLLVLGAGIESVEGYLAIKKFKCNIIAVDKNRNAPGVEYADMYINASIHNHFPILKKIKKKKLKIDGIISFGDVAHVTTKLCKILKINSIPLNSAIITSNKFLFKKKIQNHFNIPKFKKISKANELKALIKKNKTKFIIKPVDNSGARGVILIDKNTNLNWVLNYCKKYSKKKYLIAEEFIKGPQLSTEGIVYNRKYFHLCSFDRNYELINKYKPFIIENGGSTPSPIAKKYNNQIVKTISKMVKYLNLKNATIKGDLIISKNKIFVIEFALRLSGGWLSSVTIPYSTGINIIDHAVKNSLNLNIEQKNLYPKFHKHVVQRYLFPEIGRIKSVRLKEKSLIKNKDILAFKLFAKKNKVIEKIDSHASRIGHVIVKSSSKKKGIIFAKRILNNVEIKYYKN